MTSNVLTIDTLEIGYGGNAIVKDFSLSVKKGEFISLLGPSGSGKSSILRALAGFLPPMSGKIVLAGRDITSQPPERRDIGIVFQNYALFPNMSAYENIAFALRVARRPQPEIDRRVHEVASMASIVDYLARKPANLSGGQQQRVAIARALVTGAQVLLFDEPLSNLDAAVRAVMRREIRRLQQDIGFTAIFVTHDQEDALTMSDRIVVLHEGRIEQVGDGRTLYRQPATPFICRFIGATNELSPAIATRLLGREVTGRAFVRLENLLLGTGDGLPMTIGAVEFLGAYSRIELLFDDMVLSALVLGDAPFERGATIPVTVRPDAMHIFAEPMR
ncbi:ABC transporter ATP-binding protein [Agrobacterium sp. NPDC089420]|uniref:ABC transporter ATP-binding protein n=1 Tax=Agrobacterium sp. NPDC089420 TaxID=3363918 RepID=UPI0038513656